MLSPKKVKYRKQQKGKMRGVARRGCHLNFGEFGLQAIGCGAIEWEKERVLRKVGWLLFALAESCMKCRALAKRWPKKHFVWQRISFQLKHDLLRGVRPDESQ
jgi:hypothetical protein